MPNIPKPINFTNYTDGQLTPNFTLYAVDDIFKFAAFSSSLIFPFSLVLSFSPEYLWFVHPSTHTHVHHHISSCSFMDMCAPFVLHSTFSFIAFYLWLMNSLNFNASRHFARCLCLSHSLSISIFLILLALPKNIEHWWEQKSALTLTLAHTEMMKINERKKDSNRKTIHFECHNILYYYPTLGISIVRFSQFTYKHTHRMYVLYYMNLCEQCVSSFLRCHDFSEQVDNQARTKNIKTTLMTFIIHCWTSERDLRALYNKFSLCAREACRLKQKHRTANSEATEKNKLAHKNRQTCVCGTADSVEWMECFFAMQSRANDFLFRLIESIVNASKGER